MTGAAIVRNEAVRQHFHAIVWIPLGQSPVISKLQNLCHMQLMSGEELSSELSEEEKKQALQQAMLGKRILLCLDDLWEDFHEAMLNFVDVSAGSKALISTRVQGLLVGAHQVEVGLPSTTDSVRMLLSAAEADEDEDEPMGVREVVDLCGRLPLALGIAGRLAASLGLVGTRDWRGIIGVLREELRESHSGGTEEGMIRASLRGLKGSATEQANVRSLLLLFACVPEDTHAPLPVLMLMFNALNNTGPPASIMHIRKWLRILINRSLILGTVDRPSVHDLVLDFTVAQQSKEQLRRSHRAIVEAFRSSRPADAHGRRKYDRAHRDDKMSVYVCDEIEHHVKRALEADMAHDELVTLGWLADVPHDIIVYATADALGADHLSNLAASAEASSEWWLAARYWACAQWALPGIGFSKGLSCTVKAVVAMDKLSSISDTDKEDFFLNVVADLASAWDVGNDLGQRPEMVKRVLATGAALRDPLKVGVIQLVSTMKLILQPDVHAAGRNLVETTAFFLKAAEADPDPAVRAKCLIFAYNFSWTAPMMWDHPTFSWNAAYGVNGTALDAAIESYDYDVIHQYLNKALSTDSFISFAAPCVPLAIHWGDLARVDKYMDRCSPFLRRMMQEPDAWLSELINIICGILSWSTLVYSCRMSASQCRVIFDLMESFHLTWSEADDIMSRMIATMASKGQIRKLGDKQVDGMLHAGEGFVVMLKCAIVLMATDLPVSKAEIVRSLPSVDTISTEYVTRPRPDGKLCNLASTTHLFLNVFLYCAYVYEKIGQHDQALNYAVAGLVPAMEKGGTTLTVSRVLLMSTQARALAALGRPHEAGPVFVQAVEQAHRSGLYLYEVLALRDLKVCVLNAMGHGDHGSRLLGAALRLLIGPAEMLTTMLDGIDAAETMVLPEPDPSYKLRFAMKDAAQSTLRQELSSMKLSALRKRAQAEGVDVNAMEQASDGDNERRDLVQLIVERQHGQHAGAETETTCIAALQAELSQLRPRALRARAREMGVEEDLMEDALDADDVAGALTALIIEHTSFQRRGTAGLTASSSDPDRHPSGQAAAAASVARIAALRTELLQLRPRSLRARAREMGVDEDTVEDSLDADDVAASLITAICDHFERGERTAIDDDATQAKAAAAAAAAELQAMGLGALQKRALTAGLHADAVADALDDPEPKAALIRQLLDVAAESSVRLQAEAVEAEAEAEAALHAELGSLRLGGLQKRALASGVEPELLSDALDSGDPHLAVVKLILQQRRRQRDSQAAVTAAAVAAEQWQREQALRAELQPLGLGRLQRRAAALGVSEDAVEQALDADDAKQALMQLLISSDSTPASTPAPAPAPAPAGKKSTRPHHQPASQGHHGAVTKVPLSSSYGGHITLPGGRHIMLSYQWAYQEIVTRARRHLQASGFDVWQDVAGGMQNDIFDSMAEGVSGAAVILAFLAPSYQRSENCKLELKFGKQTGVPIVPVMLANPDEWQASGWLGIVTAGALWTPLSDATFEQNMAAIVTQIEMAVPALDASVTGQRTSSGSSRAEADFMESEHSSTVEEMRAELERLRMEVMAAPTKATRAVLGGPFVLPAAVPDTPAGLMVSAQMNQLVAAVVSPDTNELRVGFCGCGGIGKTTTASWLVRQEVVRNHFDILLWISLGQTPNLDQCQDLMFFQLTGSKLSSELDKAGKHEAMKQAMEGKAILLCLDDVWDETHPASFVFLDRSTKSRVLISSRTRGALAGARIVQVGYPSEADALQILMGAAGRPAAAPTPQGASEILAICRLLPLTLSIAGRLVSDLDLSMSDEWSDALDLMREDLLDGGHARSAVDNMIAASLRAIQGPQADNIRTLLSSMGLIPEDVRCPIQALSWVYEAAQSDADRRGQEQPPTLAQLRRWTHVLIDRSLVLGPVDKPSLHDIVLDHCCGLFSERELRSAHRRLVNIFRERRPVGGWGTDGIEDRLSEYVCKHAEEHIRQAWMQDWAADDEAISWLDDYDTCQDVVPLAAAVVLGHDKCCQLAKRSEEAGNWWSAALCWSATAKDVTRREGKDTAKPAYIACANCLESMHAPSSPAQRLERDRLDLSNTVAILTCWHPPDLPLFKPRLDRLLQTDAKRDSPEISSQGCLVAEIYPVWCGPQRDLASIRKLGHLTMKWAQCLLPAIRGLDRGDPKRSLLVCVLIGFVAHHPHQLAAECPGFSWEELFGADGAYILEAVEFYNFGSMHDRLKVLVSFDSLSYGLVPLPLFWHWGNLRRANEVLDVMLAEPHQQVCSDATETKTLGYFWGAMALPTTLYLMGRSRDAVEAMRTMKTDMAHLEDTIEIWSQSIADFPVYNATVALSHLRVMYALVMLEHDASSSAISPEQLELALPDDIQALALAGVVHNEHAGPFHPSHHCLLSSCVYPALLNEKLGRDDAALACCELATVIDQSQGGDPFRSVHSTAHRCRGRILAARGEVDAATAAFESAVSSAASIGLCTLEALAVRDLMRHVLAPAGRAAEGERRLATMVGRLAMTEVELDTLP
jgi:hypothetical protein